MLLRGTATENLMKVRPGQDRSLLARNAAEENHRGRMEGGLGILKRFGEKYRSSVSACPCMEWPLQISCRYVPGYYVGGLLRLNAIRNV